MNRGTREKILTRADLKAFDGDAKRAALLAMNLGGRGRITSQGHAFIKGPSGETMSIARDSTAPNCKQNIEAALRRVFPDTYTAQSKGTPMHSNTPVFTDAIPVTLPEATNGNGAAVAAKIECPVKRCEQKFATEGALYSHSQRDHETCTWEGPDADHDDPNYRCDYGPGGLLGAAFIGVNAKAVSGHVNTRHRGNRPWEHVTAAARKQAAANGLATKAAKKAASVPAGTTLAEATKAVSEVTVSKRADGVLVAEGPKPDLSKLHDEHGNPAVVAPTSTPEHRGISTPGAKITELRRLYAEMGKILGADPEVISELKTENRKLKAENADLRAQLDLIAEALHINKK